MENGETYDPDLDLEAEIEAFLDEDITEITEPLWKAELTDALHDQVHDVDILKGIIGSRVLPEELRSQVWPSLLGVRGKSNSYSTGRARVVLSPEEEQLLDRHCQRFDGQCELAKGIMRSYVNSKDLKYDSSDLILILEGLLDLELSDGDLYNCFYAILTRYRPRTREQLVTILDLLVQFFDPMLFRQLQVRRLDITQRASEWVSCCFRNCLTDNVSKGLWDILLQSGDSSLSVFIALVFIMNSRDQLLDGQSLPALDEINVGDLDDLIQLAKFYQTKTPKSFCGTILSTLFGIKNGPNKATIERHDKTPIQSNFVVPISAGETVKHVLNATAGIILDIRPEADFDTSHLIGSLRIRCVIDPGLMDGMKLRGALEKFSADISAELAKDDDQEIPFLTLIGLPEADSTMYTCANELVRIGFIGVSAVRGGFDAIEREVQSIGSEDLLLWRNPDDGMPSSDSSFSWFSNPLSSNFTSALNSINSTLETMLTVQDSDVDDQF